MTRLTKLHCYFMLMGDNKTLDDYKISHWHFVHWGDVGVLMACRYEGVYDRNDSHLMYITYTDMQAFGEIWLFLCGYWKSWKRAVTDNRTV